MQETEISTKQSSAQRNLPTTKGFELRIVFSKNATLCLKTPMVNNKGSQPVVQNPKRPGGAPKLF
eukprot:6468130-Ditylum_brightwellii.AAC.1